MLLLLACETATLAATSTAPEREDVAGCRTSGTVTQGTQELVANGLYNGWGEQAVWDYSWSGGWSHEAFTRDEYGCITLEERRRVDAGTETYAWSRTSTCNHSGDPISQVIESGGTESEFDLKNEYDGNERARAETYLLTGEGEKTLTRWDEWEYTRGGEVERWSVGFADDEAVADSTTYRYEDGLLTESFYVGTVGVWIERFSYDDGGRLEEIAFDDDADGDTDAIETRKYEQGWDWPVLFVVDTGDDATDRVETRTYDCD